MRPYPVLILSAGGASAPDEADNAAPADLKVSFDEASPGLYADSGGNYRVNAAAELRAADRRWARQGGGAALFSAARGDSAGAPLVVEARSGNALFAPNRRIGDFTLEFWLYPLNLENGEQILSWASSRRVGGAAAGAEFADQRIVCAAAKNRLEWSFTNFFTAPDGAQFLDLRFAGGAPVVPKTWSHHAIRFDAATGMIEYAVDGGAQAVEYASPTGHEGGEVYTPLTGSGGAFSLGGGFSGLIDEFAIYGAAVTKPVLHKYAGQGRVETLPIDLGEGSSEVLLVEARGGRATADAANGSGELRDNGRFRFSGDSEMQFFIRTSENPYRWDTPWRAFVPGAELPDIGRGRYVQFAVNFYPSADGLDSPYLEELRVTYVPNEPPLPPSALTAIALDGAVQLRWRSSPDMATTGYLVYYGTVKDDYFGDGAVLGVSPIDAGKQTGLLINGLQNGILYYFRVAAYSKLNSGAVHAGEFSREVSARPLEGL